MFVANALAAGGVSLGGTSNILVLIALILFAVAAIVAWFVEPRTIWATFVAAGLALFMLSILLA